jgi:hypothetical protein
VSQRDLSQRDLIFVSQRDEFECRDRCPRMASAPGLPDFEPPLN